MGSEGKGAGPDLTDEQVVDFVHERLRWMSFLAGWMAARPGEMVNVGDVHRAYIAWMDRLGSDHG